MTDGDRKEEALILTKTYFNEVKNFDKKQKKRIKELHTLFRNRNSTIKDFTELYEEYISELIIIQNNAISGRKKLQDMMKEDEWQLMLNSIDEDAAKTTEKKSKKRSKMSRKAEKIEKKAIKHVKNAQKRQIIEKQLKSLEKEVKMAQNENGG